MTSYFVYNPLLNTMGMCWIDLNMTKIVEQYIKINPWYPYLQIIKFDGDWRDYDEIGLLEIAKKQCKGEKNYD